MRRPDGQYTWRLNRLSRKDLMEFMGLPNSGDRGGERKREIKYSLTFLA